MELLLEGWWQGMQLAEKIYWLIAIPCTLVFLVMLVLTLISGDFDTTASDLQVDVEVDSDTGIGFQYLSIKNVVGFFTIFGWTGIACIHGEKSMVFTIIISVLAGLLMMLIMSTVVYLMGKLTEDGTLNLRNAIGKVGSVYLTVPSNRNGIGKVQIQVQGFRTLDAITDEQEDIKTGGIVEVVDVMNNEVLVVKSSK